MSFPARGNAISSNPRSRDSLVSSNESETASLESQRDRYNSEFMSSSQQCRNDRIFARDEQHPLLQNQTHGDAQQQLNHFQPEQTQASLPVQPPIVRSSPIAIQRVPGDGKTEVDESHVDDDGGGINVERDYFELEKKRRNKVAQSYIQDSSTMHSSNDEMRSSESALRAPKLKSMSQSRTQFASLPLMNLNEGQAPGEPPVSVSYGSLRDSHLQGKFLCGPQSYMEPTSGKIRSLDHRLRYHGKQPELNVGERLEQSRKLKELRQRQESKKMKEGSSCKADGDDGQTSSLTTLMTASGTVNTSTSAVEYTPVHKGSNDISSVQTYDRITSIDESSRNNMSTSLTAFELLKYENAQTIPRSNSTVDRSLSVKPATDLSQHGTAAMGVSFHGRFQPFKRTMSDPSPRFHHFSLSDTHPPSGLAAETELTRQQPGNAQLFSNNGTGNNRCRQLYDNNVSSSDVTSQQDMHVFHDNGGQPSPHQDDDSNMEGAFDMDDMDDMNDMDM